jgi:hypothetical protein
MRKYIHFYQNEDDRMNLKCERRDRRWKVYEESMLDRTEFEPFGIPKQSIHDFSIGRAARQGHTRNRAAVIELTLRHPNFSGFQIDEIISEWFTIKASVQRTSVSKGKIIIS